MRKKVIGFLRIPPKYFDYSDFDLGPNFSSSLSFAEVLCNVILQFLPQKAEYTSNTIP